MSEQVCITCDGRRWVTDIATRVARRCECSKILEERELVDLLIRAGMEDDELSSALEPWQPRLRAEPEQITGWGELVAQGGAKGVMAIYGDPGVGKTKAAAMSLAGYFRAGGRRAVWANVPAALGVVMRERMAHGSSAYEARLLASPFLVLDDVATERGEGRRADAVEEWIYSRHRRRNSVSTLITTNASEPDELGDGRIASRLNQAAQVILEGDLDYRELAG